MNAWIILLLICIAAFCGAVLEHRRLRQDQEFRMQHLHTCYLEVIKQKHKLTETLAAEHAEPIDVILDRLLEDCPDESQVKTFAAGQDPRD